ncbi:MAG: tRNA uridine-5-carboxymethylaminomethyl(34) synthesis enzyme MnmG [Clostridia bacterium]|nr:tRNA uridine-5-carboxymethylaminomethyl(34) synthesis enzyme MnmG [Clostridia bacterium]
MYEEKNDNCFNENKAQVAIIGAGHAGIEAALACARTGIDTVLFTMSLDAVGNMPCNPSIGGTGKGHLVYEIDALGGEMGRAADLVTMQSRTLNLGKGAAVHSKRIQADRRKYQMIMKKTLEKTENLRLIQTEITEIITEKTNSDSGTQRITGLVTSLGDVWRVEKVIICSGTYLDSQIFVGNNVYESGPDALLPSRGLADSLRAHGVNLMRFKTGTPARIKRSSIDFSSLEVQAGEEPITPYSSRTGEGELDELEQVPCHIVYTNGDTHNIIKENIKRSAMYSGNITGTGPRYCPSIEDKIVRFADKERHQLFVEPMGEDTEEMYLQGFSTSMPTDVQMKMIHSLCGFERAQVMRYAYAIEYDCVDPLSLHPTLEFKEIEGLYGAGQFNGTSGYEEAAAQGLVAGLNASLALRGREPLILQRSGSYIGTLIDDLVTKGTNEPYRMMTSRSEYRLLLRQDNADLRLSKIGHECGLLSDEEYDKFLRKKSLIEEEIKRLEKTNISPDRANKLLERIGETAVSSGVSLADLLRRPAVTYEDLSELDNKREDLPRAVKTTVQVSIKYEGYIKKQMAEVRRQASLEEKVLPTDIDYMSLKGLRIEAAQKLTKIRPMTVGQASRISGVSPADISVLLIYLGIK